MKKFVQWLKRSRWEVLRITAALTLIGLIWVFSYWLFIKACRTPIKQADPGVLATALFGASSIALFILSFLFAVFATLSWHSYKDFRDKVAGDIGRIENELRGRVATVLGYAIGEMSLRANSFDAGDRSRLAQAVAQCREGYRYLQKVGDAPALLGLNNLIFYACVLNEGKSSRGDEEYMLKEARRLRDAGEEHDSPMLRLTACRVLLEYGAEAREKEQAREALRALEARTSGISEREREEATFYLNKYH